MDGTRPPYAWRVTKYDPADRDAQGRYIGDEDSDSDHGPIEAAYLATVAAFAAESGVDVLQVREPSVPSVVGLDPGRLDGLAELFGGDLDGYHDGAPVGLETALELVRSMLRGDGGWCRLEAGADFLVHVGWDQYMYVGSHRDCPEATAPGRRRVLGRAGPPDRAAGSGASRGMSRAERRTMAPADR
ncbi:hypothetical protein KOI35_22335 [Actinoplanes bogorensis]|uniref:Uncharacterized protein n=1 Tax=Paractinoplanes bogorensis TaxID=1610840 RepID=A0ABS5YU95_9ACTN|nr:hypothetical protein [Actinoplanes bogorensis]MBU2666244.1 hypothetical protein [Actinoplanes bogorensis]